MARWSQRPNTGVARFNANRNSSTVCLEVKSPSVRSSYYLSRQSWRAGLSRRERGMSRSLWRCDISKRLRLRSHDIPLSQRGAGGFADHTVCRKKREKKRSIFRHRDENWNDKKRNLSFKIWDDKNVPARLIPENQGPPVLSHYAALTNRPAV